jgi:MerR family transcriptional regulator/heat shock protein HspR
VIEVQGVYIISVAARILDMHPQTLRKYERLGLINPGRTIGMLRLYSTEDIKKVRLIRYLSDELGLNLAGVEFALAAFDNMSAIKQRMDGRLEGIPAAQQVVQEEMDLIQQPEPAGGPITSGFNDLSHLGECLNGERTKRIR